MLKKKRLALYRAGHMTLPDERYRSLLWADRLLKDLCDPNVTPRVPKQIRQRARDCLRHWPDTYYIDRLAEEAPDILYSSKPATDPLYRIVKEHTVK
jgi:hypothetical protein